MEEAEITLLILRPTSVPQVDFDRDVDVDSGDFDRFQACHTSSYAPVNARLCRDALVDSDSDVDQAAFAALMCCLSGEGVSAAPRGAD